MRPGANRRDHANGFNASQLAAGARASMRPGANRRDHMDGFLPRWLRDNSSRDTRLQ